MDVAGGRGFRHSCGGDLFSNVEAFGMKRIPDTKFGAGCAGLTAFNGSSGRPCDGNIRLV